MIENDRYIIGSWEIHEDDNVDPLYLGGKALGLLKIPRLWTLPFLIFTKNFYDSWILTKKTENVINGFSIIDKEVFEYFLKKINIHSNEIFIRSNSPNEDLTLRGTYHSIMVKNDMASIQDGINNILKVSLPNPMYVILQKCVNPGHTGHMSNERRVSKDNSKWLVEHDDHPQKYIKASKDIFNEELFARKEKEIYSRLREVAGTLNKLGGDNSRFHCEWVWSGYQLWIVQADKSINFKIENSATFQIEKEVVPVPKAPSLSIIKHFTTVDSEKWKKLRSPLAFMEIGIPYSDVFLLTGSQWNDAEIREIIINDLKLLCLNHPIVIRCDIAKNVKKEDLLLPTSNALQNEDDVISFMEKINVDFIKQGFDIDEWTFLISYLYTVRASALVHSFPNAQRIKVDSLWGYPDGLLYFPYDTWYYYPETKKTKLINNFKSTCLFPTGNNWQPYEIVEPYDWESVLDKTEAETLALWALKLANYLGKEVQLMAFTKLDNKQGEHGCLPWHYTDIPVPQYTSSLKVLPHSKIKIIKSMNDLNILQNGRGKFDIRGLLIMPDANLIRDKEFLTKTANFAIEKKIPLYFQGSLLGHAYYIMSKTGVKLIPIIQNDPEDTNVQYNKLVRDKIPIIIQKAGGLARIRKINKSEVIFLLKQKIIEEAFEVWNSKNQQELMNEIADVLEIIDALTKFHNIDSKSLAEIKESKIRKRGGFEELFFLEETAIRSLKSLDNTNGKLPLEFEENDFPKVRREKSKKIIKFLANINDIVNFTVSLIPQINEELKLESIEDDDGKYKVKIKYEGNTLNVKISEIKQKNLFPKFGEEGFQLSLFEE